MKLKTSAAPYRALLWGCNITMMKNQFYAIYVELMRFKYHKFTLHVGVISVKLKGLFTEMLKHTEIQKEKSKEYMSKLKEFL